MPTYEDELLKLKSLVLVILGAYTDSYIFHCLIVNPSISYLRQFELALIDGHQRIPTTLQPHISHIMENPINPTWGALVRRRATSGLLW